MSDKVRAGRGMDDRDVVRKMASARKTATSTTRLSTDETERLGRDQQRRATAYGRARGRL
ncbi:hypothetical protein [Rubneribacter badeniensis]|uniref:hypothetical protein n=1 Tax=Rubneribacter badeniensis TaxID=2070688 RepID=UPI003A8D8CF6